MKKYRILVIGDCHLGVQIAHRLTQLRIGPVALIESNSRVKEMTARAGSMLHVFQNQQELSNMALESHSFYSENDFAHFTRSGALTFLSKSQLHPARQIVRHLQSRGSQISILSAKSARSIFPTLLFGPQDYAIYEPDAGILDATAFSKSLAIEAQSRGLDIFEGLEVQGLLRQNEKICGVQTSGGEILADLTIASAGAHTIQMLRSIGIDLDVSVQSIDINEYEVKQSAQFGLPISPPMVIEKRHRHFAKFETVVGPSGLKSMKFSIFTPSNKVPESFAATLDNESPSARQALIRLSENYPFLEHATWISASCVFDVDNKDQPGKLGFVSEFPGLYSVFGWGKRGLSMAPAIAREVSRQVARSFSAAPQDLSTQQPQIFQ